MLPQLVLMQPEAVRVFGVRLVGLSSDTGRKLVLSVILVVILVGLRALVQAIVRPPAERSSAGPARFWIEQLSSIAALALLAIGLLSIWFETTEQLTAALGLLAAGVAIALQRVITAFAAYLIILRGRAFTIGDRISMAGVRGDVIALGFMQTTIMEMGEPPPVQPDAPGAWVHARQYTGRIVRITNDKIFDAPIFNYTREFPYLWEELHVPVAYTADRAWAERILLQAARNHTERIETLGEAALAELLRRYALKEPTELEPQVYWKLTDNWLELTVRFLAEETGVRGLKDRISRDVLAAFDEAGISIASATFEIVGLPPVRVEALDSSRG